LLDEIAVGAVQFDAVETGRHGVSRCQRILADGGLDVGLRHGFRLGVRL